MTNTPFSDKVFILQEFYLEFLDNENFREFFRLNDLGLPLAVAIYNGGAEPTANGIRWIDETWRSMCEMLKIDYLGEYATLDDVLEMAVEDE